MGPARIFINLAGLYTEAVHTGSADLEEIFKSVSGVVLRATPEAGCAVRKPNNAVDSRVSAVHVCSKAVSAGERSPTHVTLKHLFLLQNSFLPGHWHNNTSPDIPERLQLSSPPTKTSACLEERPGRQLGEPSKPAESPIALLQWWQRVLAPVIMASKTGLASRCPYAQEPTNARAARSRSHSVGSRYLKKQQPTSQA